MGAPALASEFAREVHAGLSRAGQKTLPCRYFYDAVGSALFEAISALPEYGLTRADDRVIKRCAPAIAREIGDAVIVELGSGSGVKTRSILQAFTRNRQRPAYLPIDVSGSALAACALDLGRFARVTPIEASYLDGLAQASAARVPGQRLLVLFLGSTIGNFGSEEAGRFLVDVRQRLHPGDALLLGTDLEKDERRMLLAYDDPTLVTAAFNLNLLARINRELAGDFNLRWFAHEARYDRGHRRIEMHLRSRGRQCVHVPAAAVEVEFQAGETIWTESSHKFRLEDVDELARVAGFTRAAQWVDEEWPFAETLLMPEGQASV
jgi:L-histidine N-alpha-methyltransferase